MEFKENLKKMGYITEDEFIVMYGDIIKNKKTLYNTYIRLNKSLFNNQFAIRIARQYFLNPKIFDEYLKNKIDKRIKKINK